jgi:gluconolactonase
MLRQCLIVVGLIGSLTFAQDLLAPDATFVQLDTGMKLVEGPLWLPDGRLIASEIRANTVHAYDAQGNQLEPFLQPSGNANGHALDLEGRVIQAEHDRRVTRIEADGSVTVLAESYEGKRLNSPNDVAVKSDGTIYFTDPAFGLGKNKGDLGFQGIYRLNPETSELVLLNQEFEQPNGIAFSPDESILYVTDSKTKALLAFPVNADGTLGESQVIGKGADGLRVDANGNIWVTSGAEDVYVYAPDGTLLETLRLPEPTTNLTFGGESGQTLFVTTIYSIFKIETLTTEASRP